VRQLIRTMSRENPLWGAPRIHGELLKLGIDIGDPSQQSLPGDCQNLIVLTEDFYEEILEHPIPTDLEAAKALSSSPAALDLFTWLSYRCFVAKGEERIPLFGEFGLRPRTKYLLTLVSPISMPSLSNSP
jgi:hypothetical protein